MCSIASINRERRKIAASGRRHRSKFAGVQIEDFRLLFS